MIRSFLVLILFLISTGSFSQEKVRIGVAGLTHTHVHWILNANNDPEASFEIVGISEPNEELARRYFKQYDLPWDIYYSTLDEMIESSKPQGVTAFNSIFEHLEVVQKCAPRGIDVMVEKPLAVNDDHAKEMMGLALKHDILLLTNYETTWYASNHYVKDQVENGAIGEIRKVVVHDGHQGPKEIGINDEFFEWLTDPKLNGGGAIIDFGCYGANLMTWLMKNERPLSVTAVTNTNKPDIYPNVDDEATLILQYANAQAIIQASWNWPYSRKDMDVYGVTGRLSALNSNTTDALLKEGEPEQRITNASLEKPYNDPFSLFSSAIRNEIEIQDEDLSSLANNMIVVEILTAAVKSARDGKTVYLPRK